MENTVYSSQILPRRAVGEAPGLVSRQTEGRLSTFIVVSAGRNGQSRDNRRRIGQFG